MTSRVESYRGALRQIDDWRAFLLEHSGLPGPRGNLELAKAVAEEGSEEMFRRWAALGPEEAPTGTPDEFLSFCGVLGLGTLVAAGERGHLGALRRHASDPRWRIREAVAMAMQRVGESDPGLLLRTATAWSRGNRFEQRAAAAALCEPALLTDPAQAAGVFEVLNRATRAVAGVEERRSEDFRVLRKGLGYCWSVAVAAYPAEGKAEMERWLGTDDPDVRWILRENLRKKRLERLDGAWVEGMREKLDRFRAATDLD